MQAGLMSASFNSRRSSLIAFFWQTPTLKSHWIYEAKDCLFTAYPKMATLFIAWIDYIGAAQ